MNIYLWIDGQSYPDPIGDDSMTTRNLLDTRIETGTVRQWLRNPPGCDRCGLYRDDGFVMVFNRTTRRLRGWVRE